MLFGGQETRTINYIGLPFDKRLEQDGIFRRVVFKVGILDDDEIAGRVFEAFS